MFKQGIKLILFYFLTEKYVIIKISKKKDLMVKIRKIVVKK